MNILAIDTSSPSGSMALLSGSDLISEWTYGEVPTHSEWLLKALDAFLVSVNHTIKDVGLFAVGTGPGSFTGLRIGVTTVKGLAWTLNKKTVGVSTLRALAYNLRYSKMYVCPVLDARKGEVYAALYSSDDDGFKAVIEEQVMAPEALVDAIGRLNLDAPVVFLGGGLNVYSGFFTQRIKEARLAPKPLWHIRASNIALLALEGAGSEVEPIALNPAYLRKSEVELKAKGSDSK